MSDDMYQRPKEDSREWEDLWKRISNRALERRGQSPVHVVKSELPKCLSVESITSLFTEHKELSIVVTAGLLNARYATVDKRLRKLEQNGVLKSRRESKCRLFRLAKVR